MKKVANVFTAPAKHWVGNGFHVASMFSYNDKDKNLDPFLLMDYNPPKFFQGGRRDNSEFDLRGVEEHPHRGFETVTIAYQGEVSHRDSHGGGGTIGTGDVQWMTAGSGVMHEEMHSEKFAKEGGLFEMVQLWVNLPAKDKMTEPKYQAIKSADIPVVKLPGDAGQVRVIAGELLGTTGSASTFSPVNMWDTTMNANATHTFSVPESHNVVILVLEGTIQVGGDAVARRGELVTFERGGADVLIESNNEAKLLILTGEPLNEPVVGYGPFVMNTREQIVEAFNDVQTGKFGRLN
ncbi:pirin family protein [Rodentibacter pneumotropicus]|uniref:Pirin family protein n=1 Tax=Rodentibacter pneumotropicus TaxID=758 RepID=A0A1V3K6B3_9PAST|nr:pirin family protein [Rodentibacter pneumotropicus]MCQ9121782.1 pirin family protein [Rodentibacter pneumotropicus]NBH74340.1 pirin family protein [Rodentibacter pneumotropicus]OOF61781.1 quercetin 2,3-dioxygenase [Rodentibacter pneumotropicus]OOF63790.1 quercetin 2,3-dioxygenase [Rodentibacter pneumotropicus]OOF68670.1 quercetin 2,3-dioxygenase [Rodentibacter pneumotropicus]